MTTPMRIDDANSKGPFFKLSILSTGLFSLFSHEYKMASRGLICATRLFHTGVIAVFPWRHHKIIDIETQEINGDDEVSGNNSTQTHETTEEQQPNNLDPAVEDAGKSENEEAEWNYLGNELDLCFFGQIRYESEVEAYETMKDLQGIQVPRMFAHTKILGPTYTQDQPISRYFEHPGILIEYIEGFPRPYIAENVPRKE